MRHKPVINNILFYIGRYNVHFLLERLAQSKLNSNVKPQALGPMQFDNNSILSK